MNRFHGLSWTTDLHLSGVLSPKQEQQQFAGRGAQSSDAVAGGELAEVPSNALAATLLALDDGLMLHHAADPTGFRWTNIGRAVDTLLDGIAYDEESSG